MASFKLNPALRLNNFNGTYDYCMIFAGKNKRIKVCSKNEFSAVGMLIAATLRDFSPSTPGLFRPYLFL